MKNEYNILNASPTFAPGGQNPFYKKGSGLPKIFYWDGLDTLFFFASLCKSIGLKLGGGFWILIFFLKNGMNMNDKNQTIQTMPKRQPIKGGVK